MTTEPDRHMAPEVAPSEMPADPAAADADDTLLDMLGSGQRPGGADGGLTCVLAAWRREVSAAAAARLLDADAALVVIWAARRSRRRWWRHLTRWHSRNEAAR